MKRIILTTMALIMALALCACSGGDSDVASSPGINTPASFSAEETPETSDEENSGEGLAYWNGLDFGQNLTYDEEYEMQGDPGEYMDCAESAKVVFDEVKSNGNIAGYSDNTEYKMTLVDLTDINGEECRVYRCEGGDFAAGFAYAYQSGGIYMQGLGGEWVKLIDYGGSLFTDGLAAYYTDAQTPADSGESTETFTLTLYADFSNGASDGEVKEKEIALPLENEPYSQSLIAFILADKLSEWTGLDFTLNDVFFTNYESVEVDWSKDSTLIAGLDDREQKEDFHFYDAVSLNWFMMDSLATTLKNNIVETRSVYYLSDAQPITFPNPEDMAAAGLPELPIDQPYEGSAFFVAHADGRGDMMEMEMDKEQIEAKENTEWQAWVTPFIEEGYKIVAEDPDADPWDTWHFQYTTAARSFLRDPLPLDLLLDPAGDYNESRVNVLTKDWSKVVGWWDTVNGGYHER
jgi:hypothetical protein